MTRSTRLCHTSLTWLKAENIPPRPSSPITPGSCSQIPGLSGTRARRHSRFLLCSSFVLLCGAGGTASSAPSSVPEFESIHHLMSGDASQAHIFSITIERKKEERAGPTERMFKASVLIALFAAIPCDGFGFTPSLHTPSRFASQRLSAANSLRSGASSRPSILGLSLSSSSPPKTMDKYKLEAVGSSLASSDSGKVDQHSLHST